MLDKHSEWIDSARARGERCVLVDQDLMGVDLAGRNLTEADLRGSNLDRVSLAGATLVSARLSGASLVAADLSGADIRRAKLDYANLSDADLRDALLTDVAFEGAVLNAVSVSGASFTGATGTDRAHVDRLIAADGELSADASLRWLAAAVSSTDESARDAAVRLLVKSTRERDALGFAAEGGDEWSRLNDAAVRARREYAESLQPRVLSRCPFTGDLLKMPFDADGIDGPWWDYHRPCRPKGSVPATLLSLTGAMKLAADLGDSPLLVVPGPGTPFVLPRLLDVDGVVAVISQISIGEHVAYPISYWATGDCDVELPDDWGTDYHATGGPEHAGWDSALDDEDSFDFKLGPWFDCGSLRWIPPGDATWTVRTGRDSCPYLDLPGVRLLQFVEDGTSWT